ncbi:protein kinase, partial [Candidatus Sumerlaeota bacterium]|nr:protein kinase [Candidatus Sumerlaeota bacterium]
MREDKGESKIARPNSDTQPAGFTGQAKDALVQLAEQHLARQSFTSKAAEIFEQVAELFPDRHDFQMALQACHLVEAISLAVQTHLANPSTAQALSDEREALEHFIEEFPGSPELTKSLGDMYLLEGDCESACEAYRLAQSCGYSDSEAIANAGNLALKSAQAPPSALLYFAEQALALGKFALSASLLAEAVRRCEGEQDATVDLLREVSERFLPHLPLSSEKQLVLGEIARVSVRVGHLDSALLALREVGLANFPHTDVVKRIARHLIDREEYREASDYLQLIAYDRETKELLNEIATRLDERGDIDTALALLRYINEHDLGIPKAEQVVQDRLELDTMEQIAERHFSSGRYDDAIHHYGRLAEREVSLLPKIVPRIEIALAQSRQPQPRDLVTLAEAFRKKRDHEHAQALLGRALEVDAGNEQARQLLRTIYDEILKADPNAAPVRLRSGDLYVMCGRLDKAIEEYKAILSIPGGDLDARRPLAAAYLRSGDPSQALEQYRYVFMVAADIAPLYEIMEALTKAGLLREALQAARKIYDFDRTYGDVADRMVTLDERVRQEDMVRLSRDTRMADLIGEQAVGRYRFMEQLGSGGMGVVHKVFDSKNQCVVAMKVLRESLTSSSKVLERFFREAQVVASLNHRNIVNIYDYNISSTAGKSYIAMEFIDGPSLRDVIEEQIAAGANTTSEYIAEILYYCLQICDALDTTHAKGII